MTSSNYKLQSSMSKYLISKCSNVIKKIKQNRERTKCWGQRVMEDQQASRYLTAPPNFLEKIKIKTKVRIRIHLMTKWWKGMIILHVGKDMETLRPSCIGTENLKCWSNFRFQLSIFQDPNSYAQGKEALFFIPSSSSLNSLNVLRSSKNISEEWLCVLR